MFPQKDSPSDRDVPPYPNLQTSSDVAHDVARASGREVKAGEWLQEGSHLEVVQNVGRVGHPEAQHAALRNDCHHLSQQVGQGHPNVTAIGARVLRGQPDLTDTLCDDESGRKIFECVEWLALDPPNKPSVKHPHSVPGFSSGCRHFSAEQARLAVIVIKKRDFLSFGYGVRKLGRCRFAPSRTVFSDFWGWRSVSWEYR